MKEFFMKPRVMAYAGAALGLLLLLILLLVCLNPVPRIMNELSLHDKITQMMMVSIRYWDDEAPRDGEKTAFTVMNDSVEAAVEKYKFGAVIYFSQNLAETEQAYELTRDLQQAAISGGGLPMLICADQEGGSVFRLESGTALPGNMALGAAKEPRYAIRTGQIIGSELSALGINTNLAPVVDVNNNANNPVIGLRSYSDDPAVVGSLASYVIAGAAEYDIISCAKHFPGHGDTAADSHYSLPTVDKSLDELLECELAPYRPLIAQGVDMIMTSHILYPQLERDSALSRKTGRQEALPATMSDDIITGLLKDSMGFRGVVVTDAMNMAGISDYWEQEEAVVHAIMAGADMICMPCELSCPEDFARLDSIIEAVAAAVEDGTIPMSRIDDAVKRILTVKHRNGILKYDAADYSPEKALAVIGSDKNREAEREMAAAAVTVVQNNNATLPLRLEADSRVLMFAPYKNEPGQMIMGWNRAKEAGLIPEGAQVKVLCFDKESDIDTFRTELDWADVIIFNSEVSSPSAMNGGSWVSAYILDVIDYAKASGKLSIVQSVDKPYDVQSYPHADAVLATYGCKGSSIDPTEALVNDTVSTEKAYGPNIVAGIEVIFGLYPAKGTLPVDIPLFADGAFTDEIVFPRGYGLSFDARRVG